MSESVTQLKLAIGTPAYRGQVHSELQSMWLDLGASLACSNQVEFKAFINIDTCGIDRARNLCLGHAMALGCDWLLMVDSDTWVVRNDDPPGEQILRMIVDANKLSATIVGAPVQKRGEPGLAVYPKRERDGRHVPYPSTYTLFKDLIPIEAIGAAVMAIDLRKIGECRFIFTDEKSEDLRFCQDIREMGGTIFADGRMSTAHMSRGEPLLYHAK